MILNLIACILWFIIIPECVGLGLLNFKKENNSMIFALVIGYILGFALFQLLAIPMIFLHLKFTTLAYSWTAIMIILAVISVIITRKRLKEIFVENIEALKKLPKFLTIVVIIIVLFQAFMAFKYMHEDYDDSNFVAKATIAVDTNTLYEYGDTGKELEQIPVRNGLSPYPIYTATISKLIGFHPTVVAHTIFPPLFIIFAYLVYYLISKALFKNDNKKTMLFLLILSILYIFGDYTRYSPFVRLLYRIWQGKSMICAVMLPFVWYLFLEYIGKKDDKFYWFILFLSLWGSVLLSSMALYLTVLAAGILTVIYAIKDKKLKYLIRFVLCCIPSVIYGIISLFIR